MSDTPTTFLETMYSQLWNNVNRHVNLAWQPMATLGAALGAIFLVKEQVLDLQVRASIAMVVAFWVLCHLVDASSWVNRNITLIGRIEKEVLADCLIARLGFPVGATRKGSEPILHFRVQRLFAQITIIGMYFYAFEDALTKSKSVKAFAESTWAVTVVLLVGWYVLTTFKKQAAKESELQ
jgi:hypothetical protein